MTGYWVARKIYFCLVRTMKVKERASIIKAIIMALITLE